jgi:hypothetical protein
MKQQNCKFWNVNASTYIYSRIYFRFPSHSVSLLVFSDTNGRHFVVEYMPYADASGGELVDTDDERRFGRTYPPTKCAAYSRRRGGGRNVRG